MKVRRGPFAKRKGIRGLGGRKKRIMWGESDQSE
jgi:hypothetical protein